MENKPSIKLTRIIEKFSLQVITKSGQDFEAIKINDQNIVSGYFEFIGALKWNGSMIVLGNRESQVYAKNTKAQLAKGVANLKNAGVNFVITTQNFHMQDGMIPLFEKIGIAILHYKFTKSEFINVAGSYIARKLMAYDVVHGSLLNIYNEGVLIIGASGIGKSEVSMELINRGHTFVADDSVAIRNVGGHLMGSCHGPIRNMIELRGIGVVNIKHFLGIHKIMPEHELSLVVELVRENEMVTVPERLGNEYTYRAYRGVEIPILTIPVTMSKNLSQLIELAVIDFKYKKYDNYSSVKELSEQLKAAIEKK